MTVYSKSDRFHARKERLKCRNLDERGLLCVEEADKQVAIRTRQRVTDAKPGVATKFTLNYKWATPAIPRVELKVRRENLRHIVAIRDARHGYMPSDFSVSSFSNAERNVHESVSYDAF